MKRFLWRVWLVVRESVLHPNVLSWIHDDGSRVWAERARR